MECCSDAVQLRTRSWEYQTVIHAAYILEEAARGVRRPRLALEGALDSILRQHFRPVATSQDTLPTLIQPNVGSKEVCFLLHFLATTSRAASDPISENRNANRLFPNAFRCSQHEK